MFGYGNYESCGCLGEKSLSPIIMFAIDFALLIGIVVCKPRVSKCHMNKGKRAPIAAALFIILAWLFTFNSIMYAKNNDNVNALDPIELFDVAGLVAGASEGKGLGNQFLDDLTGVDAFIQVVDMSGETDEEGKPTENYYPGNDIKFIENELDLWYLGILKKVIVMEKASQPILMGGLRKVFLDWANWMEKAR